MGRIEGSEIGEKENRPASELEASLLDSTLVETGQSRTGSQTPVLLTLNKQ